MKIARLDLLPRQDSIFVDGEPEDRYKRRQLIVVSDDYDFASNNSTDVTNIDNLKSSYSSSNMTYTEYRESLVSYYSVTDFSSLSDGEKEELSKNFATNKSDRESILSEDEIKIYSIETQSLINEDSKNKDLETILSSLMSSDDIPVLTTTPASSYSESASSEGEITTSSSSYYENCILNTIDIPKGNYRIGWYYEVSGSDSKSTDIKVDIDDSSTLSENTIEFKNKDNWESYSGFVYADLDEDSYKISIKIKSKKNTSVKMRRARIEMCKK